METAGLPLYRAESGVGSDSDTYYDRGLTMDEENREGDQQAGSNGGNQGGGNCCTEVVAIRIGDWS